MEAISLHNRGLEMAFESGQNDAEKRSITTLKTILKVKFNLQKIYQTAICNTGK